MALLVFIYLLGAVAPAIMRQCSVQGGGNGVRCQHWPHFRAAVRHRVVMARAARGYCSEQVCEFGQAIIGLVVREGQLLYIG